MEPANSPRVALIGTVGMGGVGREGDEITRADGVAATAPFAPTRARYTVDKHGFGRPGRAHAMMPRCGGKPADVSRKKTGEKRLRQRVANHRGRQDDDALAPEKTGASGWGLRGRGGWRHLILHTGRGRRCNSWIVSAGLSLWSQADVFPVWGGNCYDKAALGNRSVARASRSRANGGGWSR